MEFNDWVFKFNEKNNQDLDLENHQEENNNINNDTKDEQENKTIVEKIKKIYKRYL